MAGEGDGSKTVTPGAEENIDVRREEEDGERDQEETFTHFTLSQLRKLQLLVGLATTTSSLTATIYFPLLPLLRTHFHTSAQAVNLTLTIYIVFQAISPVVFGPFPDTHGRRPIFLLVLGIYAVSNIGLAVNDRSFAALATLRALQSLGASATYSIAFGVVADVCLPRNRGRMLGPIGMALNLGTCIGPIIGGCVAYFSGSYNWAFWALVIAAIILFSSVGMFLPETARSLVGNGSDRSRFKWWQISWLSLIQEFLAGGTGLAREKHVVEGSADQAIPLSQTTPVKRFLQKYGFINFYNCFPIIFHKDTFFDTMGTRLVLYR